MSPVSHHRVRAARSPRAPRNPISMSTRMPKRRSVRWRRRDGAALCFQVTSPIPSSASMPSKELWRSSASLTSSSTTPPSGAREQLRRADGPAVRPHHQDKSVRLFLHGQGRCTASSEWQRHSHDRLGDRPAGKQGSARLFHDQGCNRLFKAPDGNGAERPITAREVNSFIAKATGINISAKDFRTFRASAAALVFLTKRNGHRV